VRIRMYRLTLGVAMTPALSFVKVPRRYVSIIGQFRLRASSFAEGLPATGDPSDVFSIAKPQRA
jgi:hypothetical protein